MKNIEKAFLLGMGVEYFATKNGGFISSLTKALREMRAAKEKEMDRVVDPYNRAVEE